VSIKNPRAKWSLAFESLDATRNFGKELGERIESPGLIAFYGDLGSGKTTLIQAIGNGLGVAGPITSPTYTFIDHHPGGTLPLLHVDCYRIEGPEDLYGLGLEEWLSGSSLVCMEWSEHAEDLLPHRRMELKLEYRSPEQRSARVLLFGDLWPELDHWLDERAEKTG
jgi:tRNA threonylcarbamoyladenosine biosynthesis protein TsaE